MSLTPVARALFTAAGSFEAAVAAAEEAGLEVVAAELTDARLAAASILAIENLGPLLGAVVRGAGASQGEATGFAWSLAGESAVHLLVEAGVEDPDAASSQVAQVLLTAAVVACPALGDAIHRLTLV